MSRVPLLDAPRMVLTIYPVTAPVPNFMLCPLMVYMYKPVRYPKPLTSLSC